MAMENWSAFREALSRAEKKQREIAQGVAMVESSMQGLAAHVAAVNAHLASLRVAPTNEIAG